jgi:hypothetical protein
LPQIIDRCRSGLVHAGSVQALMAQGDMDMWRDQPENGLRTIPLATAAPKADACR